MTQQARTIVLASRNEDKLRELREICAGLPFEVTSSLDYDGLPDVIEDGTSALGNATRKALVTAGWTGEIAVADDTTFQVRTLGGMPDVFASRFAGREATYADNVDLTLALMRDVPDDARDVRFETSMVWADPRPPADANPDDVVPGRMRWVHDPFQRRMPDPALAAEVERDHAKAWQDYRAWFGTLPVGWGADAERVEQIVEDLVRPFLAGEPPAAEGALRIPDVRAFTADGPHDRQAPGITVTLTGDAPGRGSSAPVWLEVAAEGRMLGHLTRQPLGRAGFGYDPVVVPVGLDRTLAELSADEKNAISHRGRAMRRMFSVVSHVYGIALPRVAAG